MREESYVRNCVFAMRPGDDVPIGMEVVDGKVFVTCVRLDGYAIIPTENYEALLSMKSAPTEPPDPSASV